MVLEVMFLGTSSMVPTKERNVQSIYLNHDGEGILIDCGEGTQRQMNLAGINRLSVKKIFISHWHGDHVSGIIGLIQTLGSVTHPGKLEIFGPKGTKERMKHLLKTCVFNLRIKLKIHEFNCKNLETVFENDSYKINAINLYHGTPCLGYSFIKKDIIKIDMDKVKKLGLKQGSWLKKIQKNKEVKVKNKNVKPEDVSFVKKGYKLSFVLDTKFCKNSILLAENSDILVCESVYADDLQELAAKYKHMTAHDAAKIAERSNSKKLYLTHFSQRYKNTKVLLEDAKSIFKNSVAAEDFMSFVLK
jgi:ribonuclease Z